MTSFITGVFVAIATFPGVIFRQIWLQLLCRYFEIPVFKVCYFQAWPPVGYVDYETPRSPWVGLMLVVGPFAINAAMGFLVGAPAVFGFLSVDDAPFASLLDMFFIWLGLSLVVQAFPTMKDGERVRKSMTIDGSPDWAKGMASILTLIMYCTGVGAIFFLDLICSLILVVGIPLLVIEDIRAKYGAGFGL
jgi:hypothetical protein